MDKQERELLEGYRQLRPESKRLIMATVITAVTHETAIGRQYGLSPENRPGVISSRFLNRESDG